MIPNTYLHFKLIQKYQREREQRYLPAELRKVHRVNRVSAWHRILGRLRAFFTAPGASKQRCDASIPLVASVSEEERLTRDGYSAEQIAAFHRLRQWYQMWGREDSVMMRHWEFLKLLVNSGKLEL